MAMNWKKHMFTKFNESRRQIVLKMLNLDTEFFPTPNQIMYGLVEAQIADLARFDFSKQALTNIQIQNYVDLWRKIFQMADDVEVDKPLTRKMLSNPESKIVKLILYIYSMESFVFSEVNRAMRERNIDKLEMFGPFVTTLCFIISVAQIKEKKQKRNPTTYRGLIISEQKFKEEFSSENKLVRLKGLTSTTMDRDVALSFAFNAAAEAKQNESDQIHTLMEIEITGGLQKFKMN